MDILAKVAHACDLEQTATKLAELEQYEVRYRLFR